MQIAVIGLGLIGGSIAMELHAQIATVVKGWDIDPEHRKMAIELNLVEEIVPEQELIKSSQVIILAMPVDKIATNLPKYLDSISENQIIIDVGSTKAAICYAVEQHPNRKRYVAAHPLAGTEFSGPTAAHRGLFVGKKNIICEKDKSDSVAVRQAENIFKSIGMHTYYLSADAHDKHLAYVSHLSHISSFMLGHTVLDLEQDENQIFNLASTGFASTVRLAKSSPKTWNPIFTGNKKHVLAALKSYISHLENFADYLENNNTEGTFNLMKKANEIRPILEGLSK